MKNIIFIQHALERLEERGISTKMVEEVIREILMMPIMEIKEERSRKSLLMKSC